MNGSNAVALTLASSRERGDAPIPVSTRISFFEWFFVILGGLPLYLPIVFWMGESELAQTHPINWYYWMNAVISAPHVYSTYCRLHRKIGEGEVSAWVGWPFFILLYFLLAIATLRGYYVEALTAVNVWQSFHYVRQVYGVSRIYARHAHETPYEEKLSFAVYHLAMPLFVIGRWDTLYTVWRGAKSAYLIPVDFSAPLMALLWALGVAGVVLGVWGEVLKYRRLKRDYHPIGLVNFGIYFAVHVFGFLSVAHYYKGFMTVTIFHAVQYLGLVSALERDKGCGPTFEGVKKYPNELVLVALWALMLIPSLVLQAWAIRTMDWFWPLASSIFLATLSAHHYGVDTFIWRRKVGW